MLDTTMERNKKLFSMDTCTLFPKDLYSCKAKTTGIKDSKDTRLDTTSPMDLELSDKEFPASSRLCTEVTLNPLESE